MGKINWNTRNYTREEFITAWEESPSIIEVLRKLDYSENGGNYITMNTTAKSLGLAKDHMSGYAWNKGRRFPKAYSEKLKEVLIKDSPYKGTNQKLKAMLLSEKKITECCDWCGLSSHWNGKPLTLQLDHVNGDNKDNRIENLRLMCPNCHSQTNTFAGSNSKTEKPPKPPRPIPYRKYRLPKTRPTKIDWPSIEELKLMLSESNYTAVGKKLGVSGNAVRKRLKSRT